MYIDSNFNKIVAVEQLRSSAQEEKTQNTSGGGG